LKEKFAKFFYSVSGIGLAALRLKNEELDDIAAVLDNYFQIQL